MAPPAECACVDADFERIWEAYPRKQAKGDAFAAWQGMKQADTLPPVDAIATAISQLSLSPSWQTENGRYVPCLGKWLKNWGWLDQAPEAAQEKAETPALTTGLKAEDKQWLEEHERWKESLRPQFEEFTSKFRRVLSKKDAFTLWLDVHKSGTTLRSCDVPPNYYNRDPLVFLLDYNRGKLEKSAALKAGVTTGRRTFIERFGTQQTAHTALEPMCAITKAAA